uniref:Uncharacterized protein n=1 Tax=Neobodo designis TaxID=312471 RepID=A0A7S1L3B2_NEODS|mmetsp:Transcript_137/g.512  ORF Transcript_137/g.512 Transcript_137/m.512 type:complete len:265 (+) Transcript_137:37-831(+)
MPAADGGDRRVRVSSAPTDGIAAQGLVYLRAPRQWILGELTVAKDSIVFEGTGPHYATCVAVPCVAIHRCRVLPATATALDTGVFEVVLNTSEAANRAPETWPVLGTRRGTVWFKAASTEAAVDWAGVADDAAAAAADASHGDDASWWVAPERPMCLAFSPRGLSSTPVPEQGQVRSPGASATAAVAGLPSSPPLATMSTSSYGSTAAGGSGSQRLGPSALPVSIAPAMDAVVDGGKTRASPAAAGSRANLSRSRRTGSRVAQS